MIGYLLAVLPSFFAAYAVIGYLLRSEGSIFRRLLLQLGLATTLSLGISAACFWGWLMAFGAPSNAFFVTEICVNLLIAATVTIWDWRTKRDIHPVPILSSNSSEFLAACSAVLIGIGGAALYFYTDAYPNGGWDAWDFWNCKARFIFRAPERWSIVTTTHFEHPDYPPLLPMANARIWIWLGSDPPWASCLTNILFMAAGATTLAGVVGILRGANQGLLALILYLGWYKLMFWCSLQYADLPLASLMLAAVVCVLLSRRTSMDRQGTDIPWLFLGGVFASLAACTKNEGLVFFTIFATSSGVLVAQQSRLMKAVTRVTALMLGAAFGVGTLAWFKLSLAPPTDLLEGQNVSSFQLLCDLSRHQIIVAGIWQQVQSNGLLLLLALPLAFIAWGRSKSQVLSVRFVQAILLLMAASYYFVYIFSPHDLPWHVLNSLDRLALHLWPLGVLAFCLACKSPAEVLAESALARTTSSAAMT